MINIGFVNLILIIANNASGFKEPGNPYFFTLNTLSSLRSYTFIVSSSPRFSAFVKSSKSSIFMADFSTNVFANSFRDFDVDIFSNFIVDPMFSLILSQFLQDDFFVLATNAFFILNWNVVLNHPFSTGCLLLFLLLPSNFTTFEHPDHSPSLSLFSLLPSSSNSTYDE